MRVVMYDKVSEDLTVYNAKSFSIQDGVVILGLEHSTGYFPIKRFVFCGLDEGGLLDTVYYYDAYINSRKVLYKTYRADLEHGDKIIYTSATGAKSIITINYGYGTVLPAHLLSLARSSSYWPMIISAF